jgi:arginine decarboxylase
LIDRSAIERFETANLLILLSTVMSFVPSRVFFTKGVGRHKEYLESFELALRDAGIEKCNIVTVSSILPPHCQRISREEGLEHLSPGQITFAVVARNSTNEFNRLIAASVGVAIPADESQYGYLSEHHPLGESAKQSGDYAEDLAATMLATTLGIEFNSDKDWDEREGIYKMSHKIINSFNITATAEGQNGQWTTVVSCAVLLP